MSFDGFRKPFGLVLSGGGALASWQAGFLSALVRQGLSFEKVIGFSAGSLSGMCYFLGRVDDLVTRWRTIDQERVIRLSPRLRPLSFLSDKPVWAAAQFAQDDEAARRNGRCELVVMSLRVEDRTPVYSRFTPGGRQGWDGPLQTRLVASCSIPWAYPPVRVREDGRVNTYVDGGVPGKEWMRLDMLVDCRDVLVLEMVRSEEIGTKRWKPWRWFDQKSREICREQISRGIDSLLLRHSPPRLFRVPPSKTLDFTILSFRSSACAPAVDLGIRDAGDFLSDPSRFLVPSAAGQRLGIGG